MKRKKIIKILLLIIASFIVLTLGSTLARFVGESVWNYYLSSNGFYFTSTELTGSDYADNTWNKSRVYFDIKNFDGDSITNRDIKYEATCEIITPNDMGYTCSMNGMNGNTFTGEMTVRSVCVNNTLDGVDTDFFDKNTCQNGGYDWVSEREVDNLYFEVMGLDPNSDKTDVKVEVTVKSTEPYEKTLTSNFILHNDYTVSDELYYEYISKSDFEMVVITNNSSEEKHLSFKFNSDEIRVEDGDVFNTFLDASGFVNELEFYLPAGSEKVLYFHKTSDSVLIDDSDFTLTDLNNIYPKITNVSLLGSYNSYETVPASFTSDLLTLNGYLATSSATLTYKVTVTNDSPYDYILSDVLESYSNRNLSFRFNDFTYGTTIKANTSVDITITISSLYSNQSGKIELRLIYKTPAEIPKIDEVLVGAKSTAGSYVKTGFFPSSESHVKVEFTIVEPRSTSVWLFSSRRAYRNQMFGIAYGSYNGSAANQESLLQFNDVSYNLGPTGFKEDVKHMAEVSKDALILDGVSYYNPSDTPWQSIFEFYMFANNEARTVKGLTNGQVVIHSVQIYESGILVLDAVPVILESGEVAYWNNVNNLPLTNVGELTAVYE